MSDKLLIDSIGTDKLLLTSSGSDVLESASFFSDELGQAVIDVAVGQVAPADIEHSFGQTFVEVAFANPATITYTRVTSGGVIALGDSPEYLTYTRVTSGGIIVLGSEPVPTLEGYTVVCVNN